MQKDRRAQVEILIGLALTQEIPLGSCPSLEDIAAFSEHRLPEGCRPRVLSHVARCERCYVTWLGLVEMLEDERAGVANLDTSQGTTPRERLKCWLFGLRGVVLGGGLAAVLTGILILLVWGSLLQSISLSGQIEEGYQALSNLREDRPIPEDWPWDSRTRLQPKGFDVWEGDAWERRAHQAFAVGVRAGLQQVVPDTPFWSNSIKELPTTVSECPPTEAGDVCQRLSDALFNMGRWAVLVYLACATEAVASTANQHESQKQWNLFWEDQLTTLHHLARESEDIPTARAFHALLAEWEGQARGKDDAREVLCGRVQKLLTLGLSEM